MLASIRRYTLPGLIAAVDACWMLPWAILAGWRLGLANQQPLLPVWLIMVVLIGGQMVTREAWRLRWPGFRVRIAAALGAVVSGVVAAGVLALDDRGLADVPWPAGLAFVAALLVWLRGSTTGQRDLEAQTIENSFKLGLIAIVVALVLAPSGEVGASFGPSIIGFIVASLTGLALARIEEANDAERRAGGTVIRVDSRWIGTLMAVVGGLLVLSLLMASLVSFDVLDAIGRAVIGPIEFILTILVFIIAYPLGIIAGWLIDLIRRLEGQHPQPQKPQLPANPFKDLQNQVSHAQGLPPGILTIIHWVLAILVIAIVLFLIVRATRWLGGENPDEGVVEEHDFVVPWRQWIAGARAWWQRLLARLFGRSATQGVTASDEAPEEVQSPSLRSLREVYRELLRLGAAIGHPRRRFATPYEYANELRQTVEGADGEITDLTQAYVRARYGEIDVAEEDVERARADLDEIRRGLARRPV